MTRYAQAGCRRWRQGHVKTQEKLIFLANIKEKIKKESSLQKNRKKLPPRKKFRAKFFCGSPSCDAGGCAS
jgi:hypothetical protein